MASHLLWQDRCLVATTRSAYIDAELPGVCEVRVIFKLKLRPKLASIAVCSPVLADWVVQGAK